MSSATSLEAAIDPHNRLMFLLDWELTMKCNLDCDYCETGIYGGHDNTQSHPNRDQCMHSIDFMFEYVDTVMAQRRSSLRGVVLNVYGGEALNHPHIIDILQAVHNRYKPYSHRWKLQVTTTTNLIVSQQRLAAIVPLIDEFTVSYHTNNTAKQKALFRDNILRIKQQHKQVKCVVLMHSEPNLFQDAQEQISWCERNSVRYLPRQLDAVIARSDTTYNSVQVKWFKNLYQHRSHAVEPIDVPVQDSVSLSDQGRSCCGGRQLCVNQNYRQRHAWVKNNFETWFCSVDQFFLYVKQTTGEVFVNKDCKMNYQGSTGPIGTLDSRDQILHNLRSGTPVIQCAKTQCLCGLCAPKAKDLDTFHKIMLKYHA